MPANAEWHRKWRSRNVQSCTVARLKYRFGVDRKTAEELAARVVGPCDVCGGKDSYRALNVDHDHETRIVRGALCHNCNIILGLAHENPSLLESLAAYLKAWRTERAS